MTGQSRFDKFMAVAVVIFMVLGLIITTSATVLIVKAVVNEIW